MTQTTHPTIIKIATNWFQIDISGHASRRKMPTGMTVPIHRFAIESENRQERWKHRCLLSWQFETKLSITRKQLNMYMKYLITNVNLCTKTQIHCNYHQLFIRKWLYFLVSLKWYYTPSLLLCNKQQNYWHVGPPSAKYHSNLTTRPTTLMTSVTKCRHDSKNDSKETQLISLKEV